MTVLIGAATDFSLGDSIYKPKKLVEDAKKAGYRHLLVADNGTINGLVDLFNAAGEDLHIGIGATVRISEDPEYREPKKNDTHEPKKVWAFQCRVFCLRLAVPA